MRHHRLDLEELLLAVVSAHNCESQSSIGFQERRADPLALELHRVPREERTAVTWKCQPEALVGFVSVFVSLVILGRNPGIV